MRRRTADDTPAYVVETITSAHVSGRKIAASAGIFVVLLVAMSLIEGPLAPSEGYARSPANELDMTPVGSTPLRRGANTPVARLGGAGTIGSPTAAEPSCLPSRVREDA
jgi:hypothetical protein